MHSSETTTAEPINPVTSTEEIGLEETLSIAETLPQYENTPSSSVPPTATAPGTTPATADLTSIPATAESKSSKGSVPASSQSDSPPPQPKRPVDPATKVVNDLRDAFPNIEEKYVTAVLIASQGNIDPAFNALLYISDPSFKPDIPQPRTAPLAPTDTTDTHMGATDDELLARQLQQEFEREDENRRRRRAAKLRLHPQTELSDSPDEFEQIKETFTQGIEEARTTLNGWVSGLAKKLDAVRAPNEDSQNPQLFGALGGSSFQSDNRVKAGHFDDDPYIMKHDDFRGKIDMKNNDESLPPLPVRRQNAASTQQRGSKTDQWQPIATEQPANSDAFLVTDSEDEEIAVANSTTPKK